MPGRQFKIRLFAFMSLLLAGSSALAQDSKLFPRPPELEPAIQFWTRVYTDVDTQSGYLHDSRNLAIIYQRLPLDTSLIEQTRSRIRSDLEVLSSGRRQNLTESQREVLALWGEQVSDATLAQAASQVRWQLGQSDRFLSGLIRSGAYRSHIDKVIREKNLPLELGVLPHVESSFNPRAYSSASAAGMWQFGRATGQRFMRIDHIIDERMDPYTATYAAMSLLEYNYSILGNWPLALTAYNHGAGGIARAKREVGSERIEDIVARYNGRAFGFASRNFYAQFLAVLDVENNAQHYFGDFRLDPAPEFIEVVTDSFVDAEVFARSAGISLEQLRADNPALLPIVWDGTKRIPQDYPVKVRRSVATDPGRLLAQIPADLKFAAQAPDITYVVAPGDSLSVIARRFDTTVAKLASLNQLASQHRIQIGQRLLLPQDGTNPNQLIAASQPGIRPADGVYNVRSGDTLSVIAARYGVGESQLMLLNNLADPHRIYPGQELKLPAADQFVTIPEIPAAVSVSAAEPVAEIATAEQVPVQVAQVETILPPAAVLPDNQELEQRLTDAELEADAKAVATVQTLTVAETNDQLLEALLADPSDYSVAADNTIEIQASETLGHYADWLGIRSWDLRRLNNMSFSEPVIIGQRLKLEFAGISAAEFEVKRREFHLSQQQDFFSRYRIQDVERYQVAASDNIGSIARQRYDTPFWLLRQYNPTLDFNRVQIGQEVVFPLLETVE